MPMYQISIHLSSGSTATIREEAPSIDTIEKAIKKELAAADPELRLAAPRGLIAVRKDQVVGYSIDEP